MKARFVFETINFQRGASDDDIKRELRANGPIEPGEIFVRDIPSNTHTKELYVYVEYIPRNYLAPHAVYTFGNIDRYNDEASFIHNTQNKTGMSGMQDNDLMRRANREEAQAIRKALRSGRYDRYIEEAKKKTGLTPFV